MVLEIKKTQSSLEAQDSQRVWAVQGSHSPLMIGPALQGMQSCQVGAAQDPLPILEAEGEAGDWLHSTLEQEWAGPWPHTP